MELRCQLGVMDVLGDAKGRGTLVELRCQLGAMDVLGDAKGRVMLVELRCQLGGMDVWVMRKDGGRWWS